MDPGTPLNTVVNKGPAIVTSRRAPTAAGGELMRWRWRQITLANRTGFGHARRHSLVRRSNLLNR